MRRWPSWLATPIAFALGAFVGCLGTYSVAILLGPWFGAMSVPMLKSWCVSSSIFIPAVYLIRKNGLERSPITGFIVFAG